MQIFLTAMRSYPNPLKILLFALILSMLNAQGFSEAKRSADRKIQVFGNEPALVQQGYEQLQETRQFIEKNWGTAEQPLPETLIYLYGQVGDRLPDYNYTLEVVNNLGTPQVKLNIHVGEGLSSDELSLGVFRLCLLAHYYQESPELRSFQLSEWWVIGAHEWFLKKRGGLDWQLYKRGSQGNKFLALSRLQGVKAWRNIRYQEQEDFRSAAGSLFMLLKDQDKEDQELLRKRLLNFEGELDSLLKELFPKLLLTKKGLMKWWLLSLQKLAQEPFRSSLSLEETRVRIRSILRSKHPYEIKQRRVQKLAGIAFPLYKDPLIRLMASMEEFEEGYDIKEIQELNVWAKEVAHQMDWWVVTYKTQHSSTINKLLQEREAQRRQVLKRSDWLSKTLDQAQKDFLSNQPISIIPE